MSSISQVVLQIRATEERLAKGMAFFNHVFLLSIHQMLLLRHNPCSRRAEAPYWDDTQ
jgi:hypothetical protein